jgi:phage terminase small subunit
MASKHLTPKQEKFVQEYLVSGNATEAYKKAYPVTKNWKSTSIGQQGDKSLKNPKISSKIRELRHAMAKRAEIDQDRLTKEYARIAFLDFSIFFDNQGQLLPVQEMSADAKASLAGLETVTVGGGDQVDYIKKIKTYDKLKALGDLGKHLGFFKEYTNQKGLNVVILHDPGQEEREDQKEAKCHVINDRTSK